MTRFLRFLRDDTLVIFLCHGVTRATGYAVRNYTGKHVGAEFFRGFLEALLAAGGVPISLEDVIAVTQSGGRYPPKAFAVTFDDGFEDIYSVAAPILRELRIPATIYVTTGWVGVNGLSWIDQLEYVLEAAPSGVLRLPWEPQPRDFSTAEQKIAILQQIRHHVKKDRTLQLHVEAFVRDIFAQCRQPYVDRRDDPLGRKLTWDQIRELHRDPLFSVGGHTHSHAVLGFLDGAGMQEEIDTSLELLREKAGVSARHYSYPEGTPSSYSVAVQQELRARGVVCCPTAIEGVNPPTESLFELKRVLVG